MSGSTARHRDHSKRDIADWPAMLSLPALAAPIRVDSPHLPLYDSSPTLPFRRSTGNTGGGRPQELRMARKPRIVIVSVVVVIFLIAATAGGIYYAARQVDPYYEQALHVEPEKLEEGRRELESRASALYSDAKQIGRWQALFTVEQINGWLATQLASGKGNDLPSNMRDPRVAITKDLFTLGFRNRSSGVETVISVDASVLITEKGEVGIRLMSVRAGALPLPVMQLADQLATACKKLKLPIRWTQQNGTPIAIVNITRDASTKNRDFFIDAIELRQGEMYVAGHTEVPGAEHSKRVAKAGPAGAQDKDFNLDSYELRLNPSDEHASLEIARRDSPPAPADDAGGR